MNYLPEFLTVALIVFLSTLSPGPAFALTIRNSLKYSRKAALFTALGLGLGIFVHVANSLLGMGLLISKSESLFSIIKLVGATYLIYLGYKSLTYKSHNENLRIIQIKDITNLKAFGMGFLTNATNPNVLVFFLSIFTLVVSRSTPFSIKALYGIEMALAEFVWFAFLGTLLSHKLIKQRIGLYQIYVERLMGVILIILGLKIAFF
ncbi:MAG: LysE family translocator [Candidatus Roizmanbacteria bacterium]|nr:MAG: LysE family translocator [Candidatus Roizmanbacteria bacterium]